MSSPALVTHTHFRRLIVERRDEVLTAWVKEQLKESRSESLPAAELRAQGDEFLALIAGPVDADSIFDDTAEAWAPARAFLADLSRTRARIKYMVHDLGPEAVGAGGVVAVNLIVTLADAPGAIDVGNDQ